MKRTMALLAGTALATLSLFGAGAAQAQEFPTKPVRILTPFPAGAGPEAVLRLVAEKLHVVYKETSQLYAAVASGELDWSLGSLATAGPLQRAGKIKFIAVTAPKRLAAFPDVPTVAEAGGPAGYEATGWTAIAAPKGLPKPVADKIQKNVNEALADPEIRQRYATFGYEPFPATREQFSAFVASESAKYADVIKRAKVSLD